MSERFKAEVKYPDGEVIETTAEKNGGSWLIGGDYPDYPKGTKIFIYKDGKIYWLKGSHLIYQDAYEQNEKLANKLLKLCEDYFTVTEDMTIAEIEKMWRGGSKGYDARKQLPSGEYYHGMFPTDDVYALREYNRPLVQALADDIKTNGFKSPININIAKKGKSYVGEGNHRLAVAKKLGIKEVPVVFSFYQEGKDDNFKSKTTGLGHKWVT